MNFTMRNPPSRKVVSLSLSAQITALLLLCCAAALPPPARAYEWIIGGTSGTSALPTGVTTASGDGSDLIKNGDVITLFTNVTDGGPHPVGNTNQPLILVSDISQVAGFTMQSGAPGVWFTVTNTRSPASSETRVMSSYPSTLANPCTYTFVNINFANNRTNGSNGAVFIFRAGNPAAPVTAITTITGTMSFTNNGGGTHLTGTTMNGGAIVMNQSAFRYSGSITFDRNFADIGGALQAGTQNTETGPVDFYGRILFVSNSANCGGAYGDMVSSHVVSFHDFVDFENNASAAQPFLYGVGGGAIFMASRGRNGSVSSSKLVIDGTSIFNNNRSMSVGGAISFGGQSLYIGGNATFTNNLSGTWGGAIHQYNSSQPASAPGGNQNGSGVSFTLDASTGPILFRGNYENKGPALDQPGTPNAITFYSGSYAGGALRTDIALNTGTLPGGNTISFYDPIRVTDTIAMTGQNKVNVTVSGNGTLLFDTYQSLMTSGSLTLSSGTTILANGAIYGTGTDTSYISGTDAFYGTPIITSVDASLIVRISATGVLSSNNGAILASTISWSPGARIDVFAGGTLGLYSGGVLMPAFTGSGLRISGNGTIDTAGNPISAALVSVGSIVSRLPGDPAVPNTASTLTFTPATPLTIENGGMMAFDLFADSNDLLIVNKLAIATATTSVSGSAYININGNVNGSYKIINSPATNLSLLDHSLIPLVNGAAPGGHYSATKDYRAAGSELWINFSTQNIITRWTGSINGLWTNPASTGNLNNWNDGKGANADYIFLNGDRVTFDDTATGTRTITNTGAPYTFTGQGPITTATTGILGSTVTAPTGKLVKNGAGALNFENTAPNTFTGGIEISAGAITFNTGAQLGDGGNGLHATGNATLAAKAPSTLANNLIIDAGKTLTLDTGTGAANTLAHTGAIAIAPTGTLAKNGPGTLTLAADSSASAGALAINAGILALATPAAKLGGAINIAPGATLAGAGAATGAVTAAPAAIIAPGALNPLAPSTLTINNLNIDSSILRFDLYTGGASDTINLTGALATAGASTIDIGLFQIGTYNIGNLAPLATSQVTIGGFTQPPNARQQAKLLQNGPSLIISATADISRIMHWTGAISATWNPYENNWTDNAPATPTLLFAGGDRIYLDDTAPAAAPRSIFIDGKGVMVSDMRVDTASTYTLTGAGITADPQSIIAGAILTTGSGKLYKAGTGTLALGNAANTFYGGIEITSGALTFTNPAQLGDGNTGAGILFTGPSKFAPAANNLTFAGNIAVAPGVTGTIDTTANTLTLTGALTAAGAPATLAKAGPGTLALAGVSAGANTANLTLNIAQGTLLLNGATYDGTINATAGATLSSTAASTVAAARATAGSTLQLSPGTLTIADLQFEDNSTLAGSGRLAGAATLNGVVAANIATGNVLALGGTIGGAGGFHKIGPGELQIANPSALGNTGPMQIDEGLVRINPVANEMLPYVKQDIVLNGGQILFNTGRASGVNETMAADWTAINLIQGPRAADSIIAGTNDIIHIGSGTFAPELLEGMHVAVNAGNGVAVLGNLGNGFTGVIRVDSGTYQMTDVRQIGTPGGTGAEKFILNGGVLQISAPLDIFSSIVVRDPFETVVVDDGLSVSIGRVTRVTTDIKIANFTKAGSGTLTFTQVTNKSQFDVTSLTVAEGRLISTNINGVPSNNNTGDNGSAAGVKGDIIINPGAVFELNPGTATGSIDNPIMGGGTFAVTGGNVTFTAARTDVASINISGSKTVAWIRARYFGPQSEINIDQAHLYFVAPEQDLGNVTLSNGAYIGFSYLSSSATATGTTYIYNSTTGKSSVVIGTGTYTSDWIAGKKATLASLTNTSDTPAPLTMGVDLISGNADHLTVKTPVTGAFLVLPYLATQHLTITTINSGAAAANQVNYVTIDTLPKQYYASMDLITAPLSATGTFILATTELDHGLYKYGLSSSTDNGTFSITISGTGAMSNAAATINSLAAMLPVSWFSELNTVTQRLGDLRLETRENKAGLATWLRGYAERLDFNGKLTGMNFNERQYATEAGFDYKAGGAWNFYLGGYIGAGRGDRNCFAAGDATLDSYFGGLYETLKSPGGWYLDGVAKFNSFKTNFTARSPGGKETTAASYNNWGAGASLEFGKYHELPYDWTIVPSVQLALTAIRGQTYTTDSGMTVKLTPGTTVLGRAGFMFGRSFEFRKSTLNGYVKFYYGRQKTADSQLYVTLPSGGAPVNYTPSLDGPNLTAGLGLAWLVSRRTQLYFDYETAQTDYMVKPWGVNLGIRHTW